MASSRKNDHQQLSLQTEEFKSKQAEVRKEV